MMQLNIKYKHIFLIRTINNVKKYPKLRRTRIHVVNVNKISNDDRGRKDEMKRVNLKNISSVVTNDNIPEGHEGLHQFLYSSNANEDEHSSTYAYAFRKGEDEGEVLINIEEYLETREGEKPLGVYAIYDKDKNIQYIGYSRNVSLEILNHRERVGDDDKCAYVRVMVFMNKAMATRQNLERECENWIDREGMIPPGNGIERNLWVSSESDEKKEKKMTKKELIEYEEKKLKLRKAMGANLADDIPGESLEAKQRRLALIDAVEGDDWSAVIDQQTFENENREYLKEHPDQIVSPFSRARVHRNIGNISDEKEVIEEMTIENVDKTLNEVRPYLIADGGNVEVVSINDGNIYLRLQGACGTCPSSTATMKMGIERSLKAKFGDMLKEVIQIDQIDTSATIESIDEHLNILRPAISSYGGEIEVLNVEDGICTVKFKGPRPIAMGIQAAIKDKFPDVNNVILNDWED